MAFDDHEYVYLCVELGVGWRQIRVLGRGYGHGPLEFVNPSSLAIMQRDAQHPQVRVSNFSFIFLFYLR